jgi:hypothetical protein
MIPRSTYRSTTLIMFTVAVATVLASCTEVAAPLSDSPLQQSLVGVDEPEKWSCQDNKDPHCLPVDDPCPECTGLIVDGGLTMSDCTTSGMTDLDYDGLADWCEWAIARAFAPRLMIHPHDGDPSMEPYWAAKLYSENGSNCRLYPAPCYSPTFVQVFYALGYHRDPGGVQNAYAHRGDSEFIVLWLHYDPTSGRWQTEFAFLSAHYKAYPDYSARYYGSDLGYPENYKGYPRIWVSKHKHANYGSQSLCNMGGFFYADDCVGNVDFGRIPIDRYRNLGSSAYPMLWNVSSQSPTIYQDVENFWARDAFCGWMKVETFNKPCSEPYKWWLADFGY